MENIIIRKATESDASSIIEFNKAMALETEQKILEHKIISEGVKSMFKNPQFGFYIVAEYESEVIACLLITYEWSDWRNGLIWWLQSVYVKPEHRRKGLYSKMYQFVKEIATANPMICGFRLYVEKDNLTAQKTYEQNGMSVTNYLLYEEIIDDSVANA